MMESRTYPSTRWRRKLGGYSIRPGRTTRGISSRSSKLNRSIISPTESVSRLIPSSVAIPRLPPVPGFNARSSCSRVGIGGGVSSSGGSVSSSSGGGGGSSGGGGGGGGGATARASMSSVCLGVSSTNCNKGIIRKMPALRRIPRRIPQPETPRVWSFCCLKIIFLLSPGNGAVVVKGLSPTKHKPKSAKCDKCNKWHVIVTFFAVLWVHRPEATL